MINEYLPWDENMCHLQFRSKFIEFIKIWDNTSWYYENYITNNFLYWLNMLKKKEVWKTDFYEYISFENILNNKTIVFLKFENIEIFKKWRKIKPKNSTIKKVYLLTTWKVQANIEINKNNFFEIEYFEWSTKICHDRAIQLNLI